MGFVVTIFRLSASRFVDVLLSTLKSRSLC